MFHCVFQIFPPFLCLYVEIVLRGADAIIISFLHSLTLSLSLALQNVMIKLHAYKNRSMIVGGVAADFSIHFFAFTLLVYRNDIVCISSYGIWVEAAQTLLWNLLSGLTNHVSYNESKWKKRWRMKMKLFVSFSMLLSRTFWTFCVAGKINWCYSFARLLFLSLCYRFPSNYEFFVQNGNGWAVWRQPVKEERRTRHSSWSSVPHNASHFTPTPSMSSSSLLHLFGKLSIIYISKACN